MSILGSLSAILDQYNQDLVASAATIAAIGGEEAPPVDVDTGLENLYSVDQNQFPYDSYPVVVEYPRRVGKLLMPIGAADTLSAGSQPAEPLPARIAAVVSPYGFRVVYWAVHRIGIPPALPQVEEATELQLIDQEITLECDTLAADGIHREYHRSGYYVYAYTTPPEPGVDSLTGASAPVIAAPSADVLPADFVAGVVPVQSQDQENGES